MINFPIIELFLSVDKDNYTIYVGSLLKNNGQQFKIKNFYVHEHYDPHKKQINNIALVELTSEIKPEINSTFYTINSICLPKDKVINTNEEVAHFSGWGFTNESGNQEESLLLSKTTYKIQPKNKCSAIKRICSLKEKHQTCYVRKLYDNLVFNQNYKNIYLFNI